MPPRVAEALKVKIARFNAEIKSEIKIQKDATTRLTQTKSVTIGETESFPLKLDTTS